MTKHGNYYRLNTDESAISIPSTVMGNGLVDRDLAHEPTRLVQQHQLPWQKRTRKAAEPVSPKMSSEKVTGSKEGNHNIQEPMRPGQAFLTRIAPWNSSHPPRKATESGSGLQTFSSNPPQEASPSLNSENAGSLDASLLTAEHPQTQSELNLEVPTILLPMLAVVLRTRRPKMQLSMRSSTPRELL